MKLLTKAPTDVNIHHQDFALRYLPDDKVKAKKCLVSPYSSARFFVSYQLLGTVDWHDFADHLKKLRLCITLAATQTKDVFSQTFDLNYQNQQILPRGVNVKPKQYSFQFTVVLPFCLCFSTFIILFTVFLWQKWANLKLIPTYTKINFHIQWLCFRLGHTYAT